MLYDIVTVQHANQLTPNFDSLQASAPNFSITTTNGPSTTAGRHFAYVTLFPVLHVTFYKTTKLFTKLN